jgi:hypothetical protein
LANINGDFFHNFWALGCCYFVKTYNLINSSSLLREKNNSGSIVRFYYYYYYVLLMCQNLNYICGDKWLSFKSAWLTMFGPEIAFFSKFFESIQCNYPILTTLINQAKMVTLKQKVPISSHKMTWFTYK